MKCYECGSFRCVDSPTKVGRDIYVRGDKVDFIPTEVWKCPVLAAIVTGMGKEEAIKLLEKEIKV